MTLSALFLIAIFQSASAGPFKIFVTGDGRADYPDPTDPAHLSPRPEDQKGINQCTMKDIADEIVKVHPDIVLWTGDIVNVNYKIGSDSEKSKFFKDGIDAWFEAMAPVYQKQIKVLATRGNHEVVWYDQNYNPYPIKDAEKIWKDAFSGSHAFPKQTVFDDKQLSFYYCQGPVLLIGLDEYEKTYDEHQVNRQWLEGVLNDNQTKWKERFIFAFGHEAAFATSTRHPAKDTLAAHSEERDKMCEALSNAGAQVYLCGHDHFYDQMLVTWTKGPCTMRQVVAGTAGAPFYPKTDYPPENDWTLKRERHFDFVYGYVLITVEGTKATIEFKGRNLCGYATMDSFDYTVNAP